MTACRHSFTLDTERPDYERCLQCGTYHSLIAPPPIGLYTEDYWTEARGHSEFRDQIHNVDVHEENGVSKNAFICSLVQTEGRTAALDIGCAPGSLLRRLKHELGFRMVDGVEVPTAWDEQIRDIAGCRVDMWHGVFPNQPAKLAANWYDLITAIDVWEHSHEPEQFVSECVRLLKSGGQLIFMAPLVDQSSSPSERFFCAVEHVFLHSVSNVKGIFADCGLVNLKFSKWTDGHNTVSAIKP